MTVENNQISADFPYQSNYIEVNGSKMHYIDEGQGEPMLFLHGIPTSCYLWRNVIPFLSDNVRCIAPDLIGMGKSDKPDIEYTVFDHIKYIEGFIEALDLKNITLVLHAWGSVIGFDYAMRHQENIKGIAFLESHLRPTMQWDMISLPVQEMSAVLDAPDGGYDVIMNSNYYVNKVLPSGVLRTLTEEEMEHYRAPFKEPGSCKPIWQYLQDLPLGGDSGEVDKLIANYSEVLTQSQLPKLMLYAIPGFITTVDTVKWARDSLPNISLVDVGDALHYAQESNPQKIGEELLAWYAESVKG